MLDFRVPVIGFVGRSNSGKTTLATKVVAELCRKGLKVGVIKHTHHMFDLDRKGKDSWKYTQAGADAVVLAGAARMTVFARIRDPELSGMMAFMADKDVVIVEGYTRSDHPQIWVYRKDVGGEDKILPVADSIVAIATSDDPPLKGVPVIDIDDVQGVTDFVLHHCGLWEKVQAEPR